MPIRMISYVHAERMFNMTLTYFTRLLPCPGSRSISKPVHRQVTRRLIRTQAVYIWHFTCAWWAKG